MQHVDPDRLALLALGEPVAGGDAELTDHLSSCAVCQQELRSLRATVDLAQETIGLRAEPLNPPAGVWAGISGELGLGEPGPGGRTELPAPRPEPEPLPPAGAAPAPGWSAEVRSGRHRQEEREPRRRWARAATALAAAAAVGVLGTLVAVRPWAAGTPEVRAASTAELVPVTGGPAGVHGQATVVQGDDGPELRVTTTGLPLQNGFYQVWVFDGRERMQAVGVLGKDSAATLPLPDTLDLRTYNVVDISSEPYDGDQTHSKDSVLRGTLTR